MLCMNIALTCTCSRPIIQILIRNYIFGILNTTQKLYTYTHSNWCQQKKILQTTKTKTLPTDSWLMPYMLLFMPIGIVDPHISNMSVYNLILLLLDQFDQCRSLQRSEMVADYYWNPMWPIVLDPKNILWYFLYSN